MKITNGEKRDWSLLIFIVPVGILLMMVAGQIAIRIIPNWSVYAGMQSSLDPETASKQQSEIQPILPDILTPLSWFDTFLTPNSDSDANAVFPPFVVFEASSTPSSSPSATATTTAMVTVTATSTPTGTSTATATQTKKPKKTKTPSPPSVCSDPAANNVGSPLPCTYYVPVSSTPVGSAVTPAPGINLGAADGTLGTIADGTYIVLNLSPNPILVTGPSESNYDFVYYEELSGNGIQMDRVILSISTDNITYYVVFNWGDGIPDTNSNVGDVTSNTGTENDNQGIDDPVDTGELYGTSPQDTGILVDVDNAPSHPPVGSYQYLAIQAPSPPASTDGIGMDSVQVIEVTPTP